MYYKYPPVTTAIGARYRTLLCSLPSIRLTGTPVLEKTASRLRDTVSYGMLCSFVNYPMLLVEYMVADDQSVTAVVPSEVGQISYIGDA